jgi:hypothetical protein
MTADTTQETDEEVRRHNAEAEIAEAKAKTEAEVLRAREEAAKADAELARRAAEGDPSGNRAR